MIATLVVELTTRDVHRDRRSHALDVPCRDLAARFEQDPPADGHDLAGLLQNRNEPLRLDLPE